MGVKALFFFLRLRNKYLLRAKESWMSLKAKIPLNIGKPQNCSTFNSLPKTYRQC